MLAFEVKLNGKRVCIAGADDLSIISTHIGGSPGRTRHAKAEAFYSVTGMTAREDFHLRWTGIEPLKLGDLIQVRVLEVDQADAPKASYPMQSPSRKKTAKKASETRKRVPKKASRKKAK